MEICTVIRRGAFCVYKPGFLMLGHILLTHTYVHILELSDSDYHDSKNSDIYNYECYPDSKFVEYSVYKIKHRLHNF